MREKEAVTQQVAWLGSLEPRRASAQNLLTPGHLEANLRVPKDGSYWVGFRNAVTDLQARLESERDSWVQALASCLPSTSSSFKTKPDREAAAAKILARLTVWLQRAVAAVEVQMGTESVPIPEEPATLSTMHVRAVVVKADQTTFGVLGTLTLEWLDGKKPLEWVRHPEWAITPLDHLAEQALDNAKAWAAARYEARGVVRWNLRLETDDVVPCLAGGSWGLPLGIGLAMLFDPETVPQDDGIVPTGVLKTDGTLDRVDGYIHKQRAAIADDTGCYLFLCDDKGTKEDLPGRRCVSTVAEALEVYRNGGKHRVAVCKAAMTEEEKLPLLLPPSGKLDMYADLQIMREERRVEVVSREGKEKSRPTVSAPPHGVYELTMRSGLSYGVPQNLNDVLGKLAPKARLTLIGPPGSGKSTLVQHLAYRAATNALPGNCNGLLPGLVRLNILATESKNSSLSGLKLLVKHLAGRYPGASEELWQSWLLQGRVLLTLDGVDEVQNDTALLKELQDVLSQITGPVIITCRVISRAILQSLGLAVEVGSELQPIYQLAVLDDGARRQFVKSYCTALFQPSAVSILTSKEIAEKLNRELDEGLAPGGIVGNPMMLSLVCYFRVSHPESPLPETRTALYTRVLDHYIANIAPKLLSDVTTAPGLHDSLYYRKMLEAFAHDRAWERKGEDGEDLTTTYAQTLAIFREAVAKLTEKPDDYAKTLTEGARTTLRLLSFSGPRDPKTILTDMEKEEGKFAFLHLTFQEYYCACYIAQVMVSVPRAKILDDKSQFTTRWADMLSDWSFLPWWNEVFVFLTGRLRELAETAPDAKAAEFRYDLMLALLDLLDDPERDDLLHHHLALAADCMVEANDERLWDGTWKF